jgi:transposase-like protein/IS1 family transposase
VDGMQKNGIIFKHRNSEEIPRCPFCNSKDVIKYGKQRNKVQRYLCNSCGKIFNKRYGTLFYKRHLSDDQILQVVYLFLTGYPISHMPPMFEVTEYTIRSILKEVLLQFEKFKKYAMVPMDYIPEVIEIDEIYIKMQGKKKFYGWLAYDPKNKFIIDFVIGKRDDETLEKLFKKLKRFRGKVRLVLIDGYQGYEKFISKYLGKKRNKPITGVINKSRFNRKTGRFYTYGLFGKSGKTVDKVIQELGIGTTITTALIENMNSFIRDNVQYMRRRSKRLSRIFDWMVEIFSGYFFFHNFVKPHLSLSKCSSKNWIEKCVTPAMACGISFVQFSLYEILTFSPTLD